MSNIDKSIQLVESFLDRYSANSEQFKEDHAVLLSVEGGLNIAIVAEEDFIRLTGMAGTAPKNKKLYYELLAENLKSAGHSHYYYAIEPENDELLVYMAVYSDAYQTDEFIKLCNNFIAKCQEWMDLLYAISLGISSAESDKYQQQEQQETNFAPSEQFIKA